MKIEYRKADVADAELLIDIYNSAFYSDYIKYGECRTTQNSVACVSTYTRIVYSDSERYKEFCI